MCKDVNRRNRVSALSILIAFCTLLGACAHDVPLSPTPPPQTGPYILSKGDVLNITVYGDELLTGEKVINQNGLITLPLIGDVAASGRTQDQLKTDISIQLVEGEYLSTPQVTVEVAAYKPVFIAGEVATPGSYDYIPGLNMQQIIATAGGFTPRASEDDVLITRQMENKEIHFIAKPNTPILPGDSVYIRQRFF